MTRIFLDKMKQLLNLGLLLPICLSSLFVNSSCRGKSEGSSEHRCDYLAVKLDENENWSIMNADGDIIVKEEYAPDNLISRVYDDGIYWVNSNNKYSLFSVKSPKNPLTKEYDYVTEFNNGKAFVSNTINPIQLINSDGEVIKTLNENITAVSELHDGMARFLQQSGDKPVFGFLDENGNVSIQAEYSSATNFNEGLAIVKKKEDTNFLIIDKSGKRVGEINGSVYDHISYFEEGKAKVRKGTDERNSPVFYLNKEGIEIIGPINDARFASSFLDGYAIITTQDYKDYIINVEGESVIRKNKYDNLEALGDGLFLAQKNGKYGIIDYEDNEIIDFDYEGGISTRIGDNFILVEGNYAKLINPKGKEVKNSEFTHFSQMWITMQQVVFVDVRRIMDKFLEPITSDGYTTVKGLTTPAEIAPLADVKIDDVSNYTYSFVTPEFKVHGCKAKVSYVFDGRLKKELTHVEETNDGWFTHRQIISDGYAWSKEAKLSRISQNVRILFVSDEELLRHIVKETLEKKGFKQEGKIFRSAKSKVEVEFKTDGTEKYSEVTLSYFPVKK